MINNERILDIVQWDDLRRSIAEMASFHDDWDGLGSSAASSDIIKGALILLNRLRELNRLGEKNCIPKAVVLSPTGTIIFEICEEGYSLQIEVISSFEAEAITKVGSNPSQIDTIIFEESQNETSVARGATISSGHYY